MHLSLLSGIILFLFKKSRFKEILACIFLILFSMITNYSASIYRSLLLFIYIVLNKKLDLRISTANVLLLVVCTLLIFNPLIIYDMGFLYSVSVSLGLILFNKYMKKNYFVNMFLTSFIAFLFSLPITLYYNYEINLMQIINNVVIVPLVSIMTSLLASASWAWLIMPYLCMAARTRSWRFLQAVGFSSGLRALGA